jgi:6-phosphogluconolactonase
MKLTLLFLTITSMSLAQNWLYIGTYTRAASKGIYVARYAPDTGTVTPVGLAAQSVSPSFVAVHPNGKWIYAVNESRRYNGIANSGSVSAFTMDSATGSLAAINVVPSRGADPCHLVVDHTGRWLFVANYSGGNVGVFPILANGALSEASQLIQLEGAAKVDPLRQEAAHAHSVNVSADNKFLYVSDLGNDRIVVYNFEAATGTLTQRSTASLTPGSGPRHVAFSRDRNYLYSLGELTGTITVFRHNPTSAAMEEVQTISTLPRGYSGPKSGAEIAVDPSGRFLYASNRSHDSIAIFTIDAEQGRLTSVGHVSTQGKTPRAFVIDPAGKHLIVVNQDSGNLSVFAIHPDTGALTPTAQPLEVFEPVSLVFAQ